MLEHACGDDAGTFLWAGFSYLTGSIVAADGGPNQSQTPSMNS